MKNTMIILAAAAALALTTPAFADPVTFKDSAGNVWTVTTPGIAAPSGLHMPPDAAQACPGLRIKLEASKGGPKMSKEQKFRGDQRWHIVCDRSQPQQTQRQ